MKLNSAVQLIERDILFSNDDMVLIRKAAYASRMNVNHYISQSVINAAKAKLLEVSNQSNENFMARQIAANKAREVKL